MLSFFKLMKGKHGLYYLPAFMVLALGFITLHIVSDFVEHNDVVLHKLHERYGGEQSFQDWQQAFEPFHHTHDQLLWAVGLLSFCSFLIFAIMVYFFRRDYVCNIERTEQLEHFENLGAALEASLDGIAIVDKAGDVSFINASLLKILGFDERDTDKFLNRQWNSLFEGIVQADILLRLGDVFLEHKDWSGEFAVMTPSQDKRHIYLSATAVQQRGHIFTVHDLTLEKQVQREKAELQEQFYQSQKMEAVGRLAGGIAHDFNNILAAINGYAEFLIEDLEKQENLQKFATNILQAGLRAKGLVDQMLAFSRRKETGTDIINLAASIQESVAMLRASLPKTIDLQTDIAGDSAYIRGNVSQITQVLMNLGVNASDAMDDEAGRISIALSSAQFSDFPEPKSMVDGLPVLQDNAPIVFKEKSEDHTVLVLGTISKNHSYHLLSIEDNGSGMSKVIMERIFEPFFTTKPVDKGTGLGLAMVHGAVTANRGCLVCDSQLGRGTRFDLYFPADQTYKQDFEGEKEAASIRFDDLLVLVVEDQEEVRLMISKMLERMGVDVEVAENGLEALAILRENPDVFDLVITDYNMPHMTGLDLIRQAETEFPLQRFILLSGYSEKKVRDLIDKQDNVFAAMRKPVGKEKLAQSIQEFLKTR